MKRAWVRQVALFGATLVVYQLSRVLAVGGADLAFANAGLVVDAERALGIFVEAELQDAALGHRGVMSAANAFYLYAHLPLTALFFLWSWRRDRATYTRSRDAFVVMNVLAVAVFSLFPCAPPRLMPQLGFVDSLHVQAEVDLQGGMLSGLFNPYAAVPSMHIGYALIVSWGVSSLTRNVWGRLAATLYPLAVLVAITITANHFFLDAAAAFPLAAAGVWLAGKRCAMTRKVLHDAGPTGA